MPLFFIFAGYFFRQKNVKESIKKDFYRLIFPYLVFVSLYCLKFTITKSMTGEWGIVTNNWIGMFYASSSDETHTSLFFADVPAVGIMWFLPAMFWCKNIYNFISHKIKRPILLYLMGGQ